MDSNYSLADLAAATGTEKDGFLGGGSGALIILFLIIAMMGGGFGGFGNNSTNALTQNDLQRAIDLNSIQSGQAGISSDIQRGIYEINGATKDASYNNLGEIRDVQAATSNGFYNTQAQIATGFSNMQNCCCETKQAIMENRYTAAQNTAAIQATSTENTQKILDAISQSKIDSLTAQVNQLQLQNAVSGVVRYPMASTYSSGANPFCGCSANF